MPVATTRRQTMGKRSTAAAMKEVETPSKRVLSVLFRPSASTRKNQAVEERYKGEDDHHPEEQNDSGGRAENKMKKTSTIVDRWPWKALGIAWVSLLFHGWLYLRWFPAALFLYLIVIDLAVAATAVSRLGHRAVLGLSPSVWIPERFWHRQLLRSLSALVVRGPKRPAVSYGFVSVAVTTLLVLVWVLDATFRVAWWDGYHDVEVTRVGHVDAQSATLWLRYPPSSSSSSQTPSWLTLRLFYRPKDGADWNRGPVVNLTAVDDWTGTVRLERLQPNTDYTYAWVHDRLGHVQLMPFSVTGRRSARASQGGAMMERFHFKTWPRAGAPSQFSFVFGSCLKAGFPYGQSGVPGFQAIHRYRPDFVLFLGDFIYIDLGLNFGDYRRLYREVLGQPETVRLLSSASALAMFDDHEIENNWQGGQEQEPYVQALPAFQLYWGSANPRLFSSNATHYYTFNRGNTAFFVMDVRSHRVTTDAQTGHVLAYTDPRRSMLGASQLGFLKSWLQAMQSHGYTFKFLVTPIPFTYNWYEPDSWFGFQHERQLILDYIHQHHIDNVIVLSGDRHQVGVTQIEWKDPDRQPVVEFSVSPLNQFAMPIPWYKETDNAPPFHFPSSAWKRDRKLYYAFWTDQVQVGRMYVDSSSDRPRVVFCLFGQHPSPMKQRRAESVLPSWQDVCGGLAPEDGALEPLFQHVVYATQGTLADQLRRKTHQVEQVLAKLF